MRWACRGLIVLSHPLAKRGAPVLRRRSLGERRVASAAPRKLRGDGLPAIGKARYTWGHAPWRCDYFARFKRITTRPEAVGPGPHPKRTIMCADSVCTRGTDPFGQICSVSAFLRRSVSQVAEFASKPPQGPGWFYARKQHAVVATTTAVGIVSRRSWHSSGARDPCCARRARAQPSGAASSSGCAASCP